MNKSTWLKPLTYGLVFLLGPFLVYYLFYVQAREDALIGRYYAHLTNITDRTEARFNSVSQVIESACDDVARFPVQINQSDLGLSFEAANIDKVQPGCNAVESVASERLATFISQRQLLFSIAGNNNTGTGRPDIGALSIGVNPRVLVGNIDPANRFHDIFIFDSHGNVVFQKHPENGRIDNFDSLRNRELSDSNGGLIDDPLADLRTDLFGRQFLRMSQPLQLDFRSSVRAASETSEDSEAGEGRTEEGVDQEARAAAWQVVGLIEMSEFNSEKGQFHPDTVVWIGLAVALVILLTPILKLGSLGSLQPFKKMDVFLLIAAFFTLTALSSLLVLQVHTRSGLDKFMEDRLGAIATEMSRDLELEIASVLRELDDIALAMRKNVTEKSIATNVDYCSKEITIPNTTRGNLLQPDSALEKYLPNSYPYFKQAYLIDGDGCQMIKWSTQPKPSNRINVKDREYFKRSKPIRGVDELELLQIKDARSNPPGHNFSMEFITSRTTGEKSIALSKPVQYGGETDTCLTDSKNPCVAAMTIVTLRTFEAVLPYGFGFALVDGKGKILFHHEGIANTELNLANELGDDSELQAALYGQKEADFPADYQGGVHHFKIMPLNILDSNLFLATFHTSDITVLPTLESAGVAMIVWIIWFSISLSAAILAWQFIKHAEWPRLDSLRAKLADYAHWFVWVASILAAVCALLPGFTFPAPYPKVISASAGLALWLWLFKSGDDLKFRYQVADMLIAIVFALALYFILLWPLIIWMPIVVGFALIFWLFRRGGEFHDHTWLTVAAACAILLATSSLPIYGFLKLTQSEASASLMQLQLREHALKVESQRRIIRDWKGARIMEKESDTKLRTASFQDSPYYSGAAEKVWKQYPLFETGYFDGNGSNVPPILVTDFYVEPRSSLESPQDQSDFTFWRERLAGLPIYSKDTIKLHAMYRDSIDLQFTNGDSALPVFNSKEFEREITKWSETGILRIAAVVFFLVMLYLTLWYVLVRVLGLRDEKSDPVFGGFQMPEKNSGAREIIYGLRGSKKWEEFKTKTESRLQWLDLSGSTADEIDQTVDELLNGLNDSDNSDGGADVLIIDHFDDGLDDVSAVQNRIALLGKLVRDDKLSLVILMTVDPLACITAAVDHENEADLNLRLAVILSEFNATYYKEPLTKESEESVALSTLREECYHPNLRSIYKSIKSQKNLDNLDSSEIISAVRRRADAIYQQMWGLCVDDEKIMLVDLARDHLVNPNNWKLARDLMHRNYLRRDPFYRILNESFREVVLEQAAKDEIDSERKPDESGWHSIRTPLFLLVAVVVAFLAVTQPSFFNSIVAFAAAGAAALPFLMNFIMSQIRAGSAK